MVHIIIRSNITIIYNKLVEELNNESYRNNNNDTMTETYTRAATCRNVKHTLQNSATTIGALSNPDGNKTRTVQYGKTTPSGPHGAVEITK